MRVKYPGGGCPSAICSAESKEEGGTELDGV